jgi:RNA 3'-terminal phosphate cyclase (ATP)
MMQTAIPCLLFANGSSQLRLLGGTNAEFAPEIDYYSMVNYTCSSSKRYLLFF